MFRRKRTQKLNTWSDYPVTCHLFAWVRDDAGSPMNICKRLELCVNNECIAAFEGTEPDYHYWCMGASCLVFHHRPLIRLAGRLFNYTSHQRLDENIDRFDTTHYDLVEILCALNKSDEWRLDAIGNEFMPLLDCPAYLTHMKLKQILYERITT